MEISNAVHDKFVSCYNKYIQRDGADKLLSYLEDSDFFEAPASSKYHSSYDGGLCVHSLNVFKELVRILRAYPEIKMSDGSNISSESVAIVSLLHDVCKIGCYKKSTRNVKDDVTGTWTKVPFYTFNTDFPFGGHGSKSVYLIMKYMDLSDDEAVAINCHMGRDSSNDYDVPGAYKRHPLAWALHVADEAASYLDED